VRPRARLRPVARRWPSILLLIILGAAAAALLTSRATPTYTSTIELYLTSVQGDGDQPVADGGLTDERAEAYAHLLGGQDVARSVINKLDLDRSPADLAADIRAEVAVDGVLLRATVSDTDPGQARAVADQLGKTFAAYVADLETPPDQDGPSVEARVVRAATEASDPSSPNTVLNITIGALTGLLLGLVLAVVRVSLDVSIRSSDELHDIVDTPVLGSIQYDRDTPRHPLITSLSGHHPRVEAIRILRTNLQFVDIDRHNKVFVVSSSVPGEGKSTTASNLAIAIAQSGRRVALVEGDLRRPRLSEYLGVETSVGLTTVLVGRVPLDNALQPAVTDGLEVLTSGSLPPNPAEVLQTTAMAELIGELRSRFDVVLIDAPPLLPVTDTALLAASADGVILIVRHGKTKRDEVRGSVDRLESVGANLLGVVLNMVPAKAQGAYGYGYGYEYGPEPQQPSSRKTSRGRRSR